MTFSTDARIVMSIVARAATMVRRPSRPVARRLARHYRAMSDHGLSDIGFCRTRIDFHVSGLDHRR